MANNKNTVILRKKKLSNGRVSLYLDIYTNGKRKYEFLKLYIETGRSAVIKEQNRQTLEIAETVRSKRQIELQSKEYGLTAEFKTDTPFLAYFRKLTESRVEKDGTHGNWNSCLKLLEKYTDETTTFKQVDKEFINGFKVFLNNAHKDTHKHKTAIASKPLAQNTKMSYFNKLRASINQAYDDKILIVNPLRGIEGFKPDESERTYLTLDEVKALAKTPCRYPVFKNAFLFSCLTGIRKSDIEKLTWGEVQDYGEFKRIVFRQKKTGGQEYLDISKQAEIYLGERQDNKTRVFKGFKYSSYTLTELTKWCLKAGITKDVTFHTARHMKYSNKLYFSALQSQICR